MLVGHDPERRCFELTDDGEVIGVIEYRFHNDRYWLVDTEVADSHERLGAAEFLVRKALDELRSAEARIVPTCQYVSSWLRRHPEYQDLVDQPILDAYQRRHRQ